MNEDSLVCICMEIYKKEVADAIRLKKLKSVDEVAKAIGIGAACTECRQNINMILEEINN